MVERNRSQDGHSETAEILAADGTVSQGGRTGGRLPRDIGTEDEARRAVERPAGTTRVTKSKENKNG